GAGGSSDLTAQPALQGPSGPVQDHGQGGPAAAEGGGGLLGRQARQVPERERLLIAGIDRLQGGAQLLDRYVTERRSGVGGRIGAESLQGPLSGGTRVTPGAAVVVGDLVGGDAVQPRPDPALPPLEPVQAAQCLLEGGRRHVLGYLPGAGAPVGEAVDGLDVA